MMYDFGMGGGGFGMGLWWIVIIAIVAALIWSVTRGRENTVRGETAIDVLSKRYAGGEIGRDE